MRHEWFMHLHMMRYFLVTDILLMGGAAAAAGANRGTMGLGYYTITYSDMQNYAIP